MRAPGRFAMVAVACACLSAPAGAAHALPASAVDPLIGTGGEGNTAPGPQVRPLRRAWITHRQLAAGGTLRLTLSDRPTAWAADGEPPPTLTR